MPTISNLPVLTTVTTATILLVVDPSTGVPTTKQTTFNVLTPFFENTIAVRSVAGKQGDVVLYYSDINGTPLIATSSTVGAIKPGTGLSVAGDGTLNVGGNVANLILSTSTPTINKQNDIWYDGNSGRLYVYYNYQWVDASPGINPTDSYTLTNNLSIIGNIPSISTTTGALVVSGGIGVSGNINFNGNLYQNGTLFNPYTGVTTGTFSIQNTSSSINSTTGALLVAGGAGIRGNLYVGGTIYGTLGGGASASYATSASNLINGTWTVYISNTGTLVLPNNLQVINTEIVNNIYVNTETITSSIVFPDNTVQKTAFNLNVTGSLLLTYPANLASSGPGNIAIGCYALSTNTNGYNNIALGYSALCSNTTGYNNLAIGCLSLAGSQTGFNNIAIGLCSLQNTAYGNNNIGLGQGSLNNNVPGSCNVGLGYNSLYRNIVGNNNFAVGACSLYSNTGGSNNLALGYGALYSNTTGCCNIAIGYRAGSGITTGVGNVVIGSYTATSIATNTGTMILADGNGSVKMGFTGTGALFIGPNINNFGSPGQILSSNGPGSSPTWINNSPGSSTTATNIAGGAQYEIPYQSAVGLTTFSNSIGFNGTSLIINASNLNNPIYSSANAVEAVGGVSVSGSGTITLNRNSYAYFDYGTIGTNAAGMRFFTVGSTTTQVGTFAIVQNTPNTGITTIPLYINTLSQVIIGLGGVTTLSATIGAMLTVNSLPVSITTSTASTSSQTGALVVNGGVGIGGNLYIGNNAYAGSKKLATQAFSAAMSIISM